MTSLYPCAAGMITAIGHSCERTIASLRSGLDAFTRTRFVGSDGVDLQVASVKGFADGVGGIDRYEAFAGEAISACLEELSLQQRNSVGILLGLPRADRPGVPEYLAATLRDRLADRFGIPKKSIHPVSLGRVSAFQAVSQLDLLFREHRWDSCIVGGVDVLTNGASLRGLSQVGLLKEEWDGFIPGEAAAFVRLMTRPTQGSWGTTASEIAGVGLAKEAADGSKDHPLTGIAVNAAFRASARDAGIPDSVIKLLINDVNGARQAFEDYAMGRIRFLRSPGTRAEVWHVASYLGETGAAVGAIQLIWACAALELDFSPGANIMLSTSESDLRAAVLIRRMEPYSERPSPRFRVGTDEPVFHSDTEMRRLPLEHDPGLKLREENLHNDLLWQNFQELSWLWAIREQHHRESGDPWIDIESFERRLLAHLDAIAWSGSAGRKLAAQHIMSEDMAEVGAATSVILSAPLDENSLEALRNAILESKERTQAIMAVLPHMPFQTAEPIFSWTLSSHDPPLIAAGLRAITIAGRVTDDILRRLLSSDEPAVVAELIHAAGSQRLVNFWEPLSSIVRANTGIRLTGTALAAFVNIAPDGRAVRDSIEAALAVEVPIAVALLCLRDERPLSEFVPFAEMKTPSALESYGWYGHQAARRPLLQMLDEGSSAQKLAAANALYRIYGVPCHEEVEVQESTGVSEAGEPEARTVTRLSQTRSRWESALHAFDEPRQVQRLRHGVPWSRRSALADLQRDEAGFEERLVSAWEHAVVNRTTLPCYPSLFVQRQRRTLSMVVAKAAGG